MKGRWYMRGRRRDLDDDRSKKDKSQRLRQGMEGNGGGIKG